MDVGGRGYLGILIMVTLVVDSRAIFLGVGRAGFSLGLLFKFD